MIKWEYNYLAVDTTDFSTELLSELDAYGAEGWEVFDRVVIGRSDDPLDCFTYFVMKRMIDEE